MSVKQSENSLEETITGIQRYLYGLRKFAQVINFYVTDFHIDNCKKIIEIIDDETINNLKDTELFELLKELRLFSEAMLYRNSILEKLEVDYLDKVADKFKKVAEVSVTLKIRDLSVYYHYLTKYELCLIGSSAEEEHRLKYLDKAIINLELAVYNSKLIDMSALVQLAYLYESKAEILNESNKISESIKILNDCKKKLAAIDDKMVLGKQELDFVRIMEKWFELKISFLKAEKLEENKLECLQKTVSLSKEGMKILEETELNWLREVYSFPEYGFIAYTKLLEYGYARFIEDYLGYVNNLTEFYRKLAQQVPEKSVYYSCLSKIYKIYTTYNKAENIGIQSEMIDACLEEIKLNLNEVSNSIVELSSHDESHRNLKVMYEQLEKSIQTLEERRKLFKDAMKMWENSRFLGSLPLFNRLAELEGQDTWRDSGEVAEC